MPACWSPAVRLGINGKDNSLDHLSFDSAALSESTRQPLHSYRAACGDALVGVASAGSLHGAWLVEALCGYCQVHPAGRIQSWPGPSPR
ncbi:hypothetical protein I5Q65_30015 [Pseudomonas aeruginosa]|nr:hypothetical protein [Pseudomonas aeruginosa]